MEFVYWVFITPGQTGSGDLLYMSYLKRADLNQNQSKAQTRPPAGHAPPPPFFHCWEWNPGLCMFDCYTLSSSIEFLIGSSGNFFASFCVCRGGVGSTLPGDAYTGSSSLDSASVRGTRATNSSSSTHFIRWPVRRVHSPALSKRHLALC